MNTKTDEAIRVIDALGGTGAVSRLCRITVQSVHEWRAKGLPPAREDYFRVLRPDLFKTPRR